MVVVWIRIQRIGGEKWLDFVCILKEELIGFVKGLDRECVGRREVKEDVRVWGLSYAGGGVGGWSCYLLRWEMFCKKQRVLYGIY